MKLYTKCILISFIILNSIVVECSMIKNKGSAGQKPVAKSLVVKSTSTVETDKKSAASGPSGMAPLAVPEEDIDFDKLPNDQKVFVDQNLEENFIHPGCSTSFLEWATTNQKIDDKNTRNDYMIHCENLGVLNSLLATSKYKVMTNACLTAYFQSLPGPFCWRRKSQIKVKGCPATYTSCGPLACAASGSTCGYSILKMVLNTGISVTTLTTTALSGGLLGMLTNYGAGLLQQVTTNMVVGTLINVIGDKLSQETPQMSDKRKQEVIEKAKKNITVKDSEFNNFCGNMFDQIKKKQVSEYKNKSSLDKLKQKVINLDATAMTAAFDACLKKKSPVDCATGVVNVLGMFDPTGLLYALASFIYPLCPK